MSSSIEYGHQWAVDVEPSGDEDQPAVVEFAAPDGHSYHVHAADTATDDGTRHAATINVNQAGKWTASVDGDQLAQVTVADPPVDEAAAAVDAPAPSEYDPEEGGPIPATLEWVGQDLDRAQAVLDLEVAKGDQARTTLVDALNSLLATDQV